VSIVADENVCRRVLEDDEIAEGIQRGLSVSLTLDEMAERYRISVSKAKRLLRRAEGVPEKPRTPRPPRLGRATIRAAIARLRDDPLAEVVISKAHLAWLVECVAGLADLSDAPVDVREALEVEP
jgi:hypothetical protein